MVLGKRMMRHTYLDGAINDNPMRDDLPYPMMFDDGGDESIEFWVDAAATIVDSASAYNGMRELTVTLVSPNCSQSSKMGDTNVKVYEHPDRNDNYCLTGDETDEALVDRKGWARKGVFQDQSSGASPGDQTPCHYGLMGLCCPPGA